MLVLRANRKIFLNNIVKYSWTGGGGIWGSWVSFTIKDSKHRENVDEIIHT